MLIGPLAWQWEQELRLLESTRRSSISAGGPAGRIRHFDYAPFSLLVSAIRGARATVFPSLYEGFGLPVLESMILGTPVVTSREGATAEIAGDAALLIDPYDVRDIAEALRAMSTSSPDILARAALGLRRGEIFSSPRHANALHKLHQLLERAPAKTQRG